MFCHFCIADRPYLVTLACTGRSFLFLQGADFQETGMANYLQETTILTPTSITLTIQAISTNSLRTWIASAPNDQRSISMMDDHDGCMMDDIDH